jgi:hypothetical protein
MKFIVGEYRAGVVAMLALGLLYLLGHEAGIAQTYRVQTSVTDPNGNIVATATTQLSVALAAPAPAQPATQPATKPTTSPTVSNSENAPAVATYPGQAYESDRWRATFAYDANGFPQPPAILANAVWLSSPGAPGRVPTDCSDFKTAQNKAWGGGTGSFYICIRDGSEFTNNQIAASNGTWNAALQIPGGTQPHPVVITRMGVNGYQDHSAPRPIVHDQIYIGGHSYATAPGGGLPGMNYIEIFGLDFYADKRDPASPSYNQSLATNGSYQQYAVTFNDSGKAQSDHILISDCRVRYYMSAFAFQSDGSPAGYTTNTIWIDHPVCVGCYGSRFFGYDSGVKDLLVLDPVMAVSGWHYSVLPKDGSGMEHCWYSNNANVVQTSDPQHRFIGGIFAQPESMGIKQACGGLDDNDLFLTCPIGVIGIQYNTSITNCVIDGDNTEFDPLTSARDLGTTNLQQGIAGLALSDGNVGTPGHQIGQERGWGIEFVTVPSGNLSGTLFIDKPDPINNGPAIRITTIDSNDTGVNPPKAGSFTLSDNIIHNWTQGAFNATSAGPNVVVINTTNNSGSVTTAQPTVNYSANVFPGFLSVAGVSAAESSYPDPSGRKISSYAKSLGVPGITDGPSWLARAEQNWSGNFDPRFTAAAANAWIRAGYIPSAKN